jgi:hypothetical protein
VAFERAAEKPFRFALMATALPQDVHDLTVLIDGPPELLPLALTGDKDFTHVPPIA